MIDIILWVLGFLLLIVIAFYTSANERQEDQSAADRILKKRYLKDINKADDIIFEDEVTVEHK